MSNATIPPPANQNPAAPNSAAPNPDAQNSDAIVKAQPKWVRWVTGIAGVIVGIGGVVQLVNAFTLPDCDAERTIDTLKSMYKDNKVDVTKLSDFKSLTSARSEKTCEARAETPVDNATISYRIFWDGWTAKVEARAKQN
jgi:hypothetical protein